jgi:hypothetical protein
MDIYSKWQAVATVLLATGAIVVTFWAPEKFAWKLIIVFLFVVAAIVTVWLQEQKESREHDRAERTQTELLNWQRGDPKNPPRVGHLISIDPDSNRAIIRFTMYNPSEFPAYDLSARVWDIEDMEKDIAKIGLEEILSCDIATANIPSLAPQTTQIIGRVEVQPVVEAKRFASQFNTRVGAFTEEINLQKVNGAWLFAVRVRTFDKAGTVVFRQVDPNFPLNKAGDVDW